MNLADKKTKRQLVGIEKFRFSSSYGASENGIGAWVYPTGFGKTYQTNLLLSQMFEKRPTLQVIILVHRDELRTQWKRHIESKFPDKSVGVYTANEVIASKLIYNTDFLIVDELHRYYGEEFMKCIDGTLIKARWRLGLTATYKDPENRYLSISHLYPIIDQITEDEALKEGYISKYYEYNLALSLTEEEKLIYNKLSEKIHTELPKFDKNLQLAQRCLVGGYEETQKRFFNNISWAHSVSLERGWSQNLDMRIPANREINELWNPQKIIGYAKNLMDSIRGRKNLLYNSPKKLEVVLQLLQKFPNLKTICFSQSTEFAEKVTTEINERFQSSNYAVTYHSKLETGYWYDEDGKILTYKNGNPKKFSGKKKKELAINAVKSGVSTILSTATALDDGLDIPDIRIGITSSGTANFIQHKQRSGRVKRIENYENNDISVLLINLFFAKTKDEDWLRERQKTSTNPVYWVTNIDDIVYDEVPQVKATIRKNIQLSIIPT